MTYIDEYRLAYGDDSDQTAPPDALCAPSAAEQGSRASTDGIRSLVAAARTVARLERERDDLRAKVERDEQDHAIRLADLRVSLDYWYHRALRGES